MILSLFVNCKPDQYSEINDTVSFDSSDKLPTLNSMHARFAFIMQAAGQLNVRAG
jgi:hypothetical protein